MAKISAGHPVQNARCFNMGKLLGEFLAFSMAERGMKNREVAAKTGLSMSHLHRIEDGAREPSYKTLEKLSSALGMNLSELIKIQTMDKGYADKLNAPEERDRNPRSDDEIKELLITYLDVLTRKDLVHLLGLIEAYHPQVLEIPK